MPTVCPSCEKPNCGNHAACARRLQAAQEETLRLVAKSIVAIAEWYALWPVIAYCEKTFEDLRITDRIGRVMALMAVREIAEFRYEELRRRYIEEGLKVLRKEV